MGQGIVILLLCRRFELIYLFLLIQDRILMGAERKSQYIEDKQKLATAYHEVR